MGCLQRLISRRLGASALQSYRRLRYGALTLGGESQFQNVPGSCGESDSYALPDLEISGRKMLLRRVFCISIGFELRFAVDFERSAPAFDVIEEQNGFALATVDTSDLSFCDSCDGERGAAPGNVIRHIHRSAALRSRA